MEGSDLTPRGSAPREAGRTIALIASLALALQACTSAGGPALQSLPAGFAPAAPVATSPDAIETVADAGQGSALPTSVASLPSANPANGTTAVESPRSTVGDSAAPPADVQLAAAVPMASDPDVAVARTDQTAAAPVVAEPKKRGGLAAFFAAPKPAAPLPIAPVTPVAAAPEPAVVELAAAVPSPAPAAARPAANEPVLTADRRAEPVFENDHSAPPAKKTGLLASLFGNSRTTAPKPAAAVAAPRKPRDAIVLASASPDSGGSLREALTGEALPGVRQSSLFEIKRRSGINDDSDIDVNEDLDPPVRVASAAGLARLAPNGLLIQHDGVDTKCLKPELVRQLRLIERHYGKRVVVTSGYRSPSHNKRVRGAKKSLHMTCAAADIQIAGVGKWELARYARTMPGRGGVGTYCHTESVHIDVGPERDWNWRCRSAKKKKRG